MTDDPQDNLTEDETYSPTPPRRAMLAGVLVLVLCAVACAVAWGVM